MELKRELYTSMILLVSFNLALSFASMALLDRMSLGAARVVTHNLRSLDAAETMTLSLSRYAYEPTEVSRSAFNAALNAARNNITEKGETETIARITKLSDEFFQGNDGAFDNSLVAVQELSQINRREIERNSHESQRYGRSGMWASVAIGFLSFLFTLRILRRIRMRVILPLEEALSVAETGRTEHLYRRCPKREAPRELHQLASAINAILDRLTIQERKAEAAPPKPHGIPKGEDSAL